MPWVTPAFPDFLLDLFGRIGVRRTLAAGEHVFGANEPYDSLVLLTSGLGARTFGSIYNQAASALALAVPGRIIGGNHNFFSRRPGIGRYWVMTPAEVYYASSSLLQSLMERDPKLQRAVVLHLELNIASDRIGFGAIALLPVRSRLFLWMLTWGLAYGSLEKTDGEEWLSIAPSLSHEILARVVSASAIQVKRDLAKMRSCGLVRKEAGAWKVRSKVLDHVWKWLSDSEEAGAEGRRCADWRVYVGD